MWESRICNPINNITGNTIYISTHISIYIFTYISTNFPSAFILKRDFFCAEGRRITFFCVSLQSRTGRGLWAMRLEAFPSCAGMEKRIGMLNIHEN